MLSRFPRWRSRHSGVQTMLDLQACILRDHPRDRIQHRQVSIHKSHRYNHYMGARPPGTTPEVPRGYQTVPAVRGDLMEEDWQSWRRWRRRRRRTARTPSTATLWCRSKSTP